MPREKLVCNCNRTMPLDGKALGAALKTGSLPVQSELCRRHIAAFEAAVKRGNDLTVACTQEAALFTEVHEQIKGGSDIRFVNIRETAGWSEDAAKATPKIAALLALADLPDPEPVPVVEYKSAGQLLIIGPGPAALPWADRLAGQLSVSVLISEAAPGTELPLARNYPVFSGAPRALRGYLGAFHVEWEQVNPIDLEACTRCNACIRACPEHAIDHSYQVDMSRCRSHRKCVSACGDIKAIDFERSERQRTEDFDMVLDLSREPLIRLEQLPQGYFAPGADPLEQALAASQLLQLTGEFEKPRFFSYKEKLCAHARSEITGCTRCIDVCSAGAITSELEENRVRVEPHLCAGCGGCATVCPSGAMSYAYPRVPDMGLRLKTVLQTYRAAGGEGACLLFHNATDGRDLIARLGREGRGLPAAVIPLEIFHIASVGIDLVLGAIALGAAHVAILATGSEAPGYLEALGRSMRLAQDILTGLGYEGRHVSLVEAGERPVLERLVWEIAPAQVPPPATFNLAVEKRGTLDFALDHLGRHAPRFREEIALASGAPWGTVEVDRGKCTMCLACAGACPEGALLDTKDRPQLRFIERNCVQCGLCEKTCPEDAISLVPRLLLGERATTARVLNEAEVFECLRCGKPFATKQMIDGMLARLASHSMFGTPEALRRLQMCADCRVIDMTEAKNETTIFDVPDGGGRF